VEHLSSILGNFKQLYSNLGNFKQLYSLLGNFKQLHYSLYLHTFRNTWANSNSLNHIGLIETASFKLGYNWKHLVKLEECHSDLHIHEYLSKLQKPKSKLGQLKQLPSNLGKVGNI